MPITTNTLFNDYFLHFKGYDEVFATDLGIDKDWDKLLEDEWSSEEEDDR